MYENRDYVGVSLRFFYEISIFHVYVNLTVLSARFLDFRTILTTNGNEKRAWKQKTIQIDVEK